MNNHKQPTIALVGNPNTGKSALFNALTHGTARVGNWPGVTIEKRSGELHLGPQYCELIDLPGIYSDEHNLSEAKDAQITCDYLNTQPIDLIINVIDATQLERHLYLTAQLIERQQPMIVVLTMIDCLEKKNKTVDIDRLQEKLGCPVIGVHPKNKTGCERIKKICRFILNKQKNPQKAVTFWPASIQQAISELAAHSDNSSHPIKNQTWHALRTLCQASSTNTTINAIVQRAQAALSEPLDIIINDRRYQWAHQIKQTCTNKSAIAVNPKRERSLDKLLLHRQLGLPIYLFIIYLMFFIAINVGGAFQDSIDQSMQALAVDHLGLWLTTLHTPTWANTLLTDGVGVGLKTTLTFFPLIATLFFCMAYLEESGYLARAAFVTDRLMRAIRLPGKAFIPLIIGFGCNVPAIMATRTLETDRERILTCLMLPFMSCGARFAIFAIFASVFFPGHASFFIFCLYIIGVMVAIASGWLFNRWLPQHHQHQSHINILPAYHWPRLNMTGRYAWRQSREFLFRAGKTIIMVSILLGITNHFTWQGKPVSPQSHQSILAKTGQALTPLFQPIGIRADNWPAVVGLATGILAKEVVIGTLNSLYSQTQPAQPNQPPALMHQLKQAALTIPRNLAHIASALGNPIAASAPAASFSSTSRLALQKHFDNSLSGVLPFLLFVLLYFPCVSTMTVMRREIGGFLTWLSMGWSILLAYGIAVLTHQAMRLPNHPQSAITWIAATTTVGFLLIGLMRYAIKRYYRQLLQSQPSPKANHATKV